MPNVKSMVIIYTLDDRNRPKLKKLGEAHNYVQEVLRSEFGNRLEEVRFGMRDERQYYVRHVLLPLPPEIVESNSAIQ